MFLDRRSLLALIFTTIFMHQAPCHAGIIAQVDANPATIAQGIGGAFNQVLGVSWTMNRAFTDVTIEAAVATAVQGDTATAYLTTAIGPGTTSASVVAQSTFTMPVFLPLRNAPDFTIFSGLSLSAGTYYLILTTPFDASQARGWVGTSNPPNVTLAPGVTLNPSIIAGSGRSDPVFAPDSTFSTSSNSYQFAVLGNAVVPEPGSIVLVALGGITVASACFVRRNRNPQTSRSPEL